MNFMVSVMLLLMLFQPQDELNLAGKIVESESNEPIPYVNIGIMGTGIGTVSDKEGEFILLVPKEFVNDSLRFSIIGFHSNTRAISELIGQKRPVIRLAEKSYSMKDLNVDASRLREKRLGHKSTSKRIVTGWGARPDGGERGIRIKVGENPIYPRKILFHIARNELDSVLMRINFRGISNDIPAQSLLSEDILFKTRISEGWVEVDLEPYNLSFSEDVALILQPVRSWGVCEEKNTCFTISASYPRILSSKWLFGKDGSEGKWVVRKNFSPAISLLVYQ